jgi:hypothetical protein
MQTAAATDDLHTSGRWIGACSLTESETVLDRALTFKHFLLRFAKVTEYDRLNWTVTDAYIRIAAYGMGKPLH